MKKISIMAALLLSGQLILAQGIMDVYKYSGSDLIGTARSMSMAGAFGSLGGDVSVMSTNPGGLGLYRSSEFVITPIVTSNNTTSNMGGLKTTADHTRLSLQSLGVTASFGLDNEMVKYFNFGFALNRTNETNRNVYSRGMNLKSSITDYLAYTTNALDGWRGAVYDDLLSDNAYSTQNWMSSLAAYTGMIRESPTSKNYYLSPLGEGELVDSKFLMSERGYNDEYAISMATNIADIFFPGITVGINDFQYTTDTEYYEEFKSGRLGLTNHLETSGTGWNFKLGFVLRPISFWRIGVAYHTPTYYRMTDYSYADAYGNLGGENYSDQTPEDLYHYRLRTPDKLLLSTSFILGKQALISFDYEYTDYARMKVKDPDYNTGLDATNEDIKSAFKAAHTFRVGAEYRVLPSFSLRAGWAETTSAIDPVIKDDQKEVLTVGTIPHYYYDNGKRFLTLGFGFRWKHIFADFAYVNKLQRQKLYAFSPYFVDGVNITENPIYGLTYDENAVGQALNYNQPAKLRNVVNSFVFTLGFKF